MPKIVIREFDQTRPGTAEYSNFSVVVPGFVEVDDTDVFDENGVYECRSQADFIENVGKSAKGSIIPREFAYVTPTRFIGVDSGISSTVLTSAVALLRTTIFSTKNYILKALDSDYSTPIDPATEEPYDPDPNVEKITDEHYKLYWAKEVTLEEIPENKGKGYLKLDASEPIKYYEIHEVSTSDDVYAAAREYGVTSESDELAIPAILLNTEGKDASYTQYQIGNQIAYELLGQGYTVLYKKIGQISELIAPEFWTPLRDKAVYDFRYVVTGFLDSEYMVEANKQIISLVSFKNNNTGFNDIDPLTAGRGDCIALCDIAPTNYLNATTPADVVAGIKNGAAAIQGADKYAAIFAPLVTYAGDPSTVAVYENLTFPASFHYLACAARAFDTYNEWYAVSGYTRGIADYNIASTGVKLGEFAINLLQPRSNTQTSIGASTTAVNLITIIRNNYYLWGNRTAHTIETELVASDFLNIRQLCTTLKKEIYNACRQFTFDPNSDTLWINFCNRITPTLDRMKADQGIRDYKIVKVATKLKGLLKAKVRIVPIEAVEDFDIGITLEDSLAGNIQFEEE